MQMPQSGGSAPQLLSARTGQSDGGKSTIRDQCRRVYVDREVVALPALVRERGDARRTRNSSVRAVPCRLNAAHELQRRKIRCPPRRSRPVLRLMLLI